VGRFLSLQSATTWTYTTVRLRLMAGEMNMKALVNDKKLS
jgi:hypothetical protein